MKKIYILIILATGINTCLKAQDASPANETVLVIANFTERGVINLLVDSLNNLSSTKFDPVYVVDVMQSDSIFENAINAIRVTKRWRKIIAKRHCFGDWTTSQVWNLTSTVDVKQNNTVSVIRTVMGLSDILLNWDATICNSVPLDSITSNSLYIKHHTFFELTQSYRDSLDYAFGNYKIYSGFGAKPYRERDMNSAYIRLESIGILADSLLSVEFQYIDSETNRLIRMDRRDYIVEK